MGVRGLTGEGIEQRKVYKKTGMGMMIEKEIQKGRE
jgi:hypothetical protein